MINHSPRKWNVTLTSANVLYPPVYCNSSTNGTTSLLSLFTRDFQGSCEYTGAPRVSGTKSGTGSVTTLNSCRVQIQQIPRTARYPRVSRLGTPWYPRVQTFPCPSLHSSYPGERNILFKYSGALGATGYPPSHPALRHHRRSFLILLPPISHFLSHTTKPRIHICRIQSAHLVHDLTSFLVRLPTVPFSCWLIGAVENASTDTPKHTPCACCISGYCLVLTLEYPTTAVLSKQTLPNTVS